METSKIASHVRCEGHCPALRVALSTAPRPLTPHPSSWLSATSRLHFRENSSRHTNRARRGDISMRRRSSQHLYEIRQGSFK
ncbi:unnamed protein product, partial [Brenthis ino]